MIVRDQSGKEMAIKDKAGKELSFTRGGSGTENVSFEAPAEGFYRIIVVTSHSSKYPEESLAGGPFLIRVTQE